jgi:WD40 repeat protein
VVNRAETLLASAARDGTICLWQWPGGQLLRILTDRMEAVTSLTLTPDGTRLISGSVDRLLRLWNVADGRLLQTLPGHLAAVQAVALTPDGTTLVSGDADGVMILWDLATGVARSFMYDPKANQMDGLVYTVNDKLTGRTLTYTLPCGAPIPAGAVCVCNCVPGTYRPAFVLTPAPPRAGATLPNITFVPGGTTSYCSCNKVCTCIPVYLPR